MRSWIKLSVIGRALLSRLGRLRRQQSEKDLSKELLAIGHRAAARLDGKPVPHGDLLYDDKGLPR